MKDNTPEQVLSGSRLRVANWIESSRVQTAILVLIAINAVTLGMETSASIMASIGPWLLMLDDFVIGVFVIEILAKLYARHLRFFRDPWNVFDFIIVSIALIPASGPLAVLRTLRVLRVLRLISVMPRLRFVVESLLHAIPGISAIAGLMLILFYVFSVMATGLFGEQHAEWFGNIGASMYTLFQIMTLESWSMGIVRPVMETHPQAWLFFVPFILIATFTILNLFIAIIVDTMQTMHDKTRAASQQAVEHVVHDETVVLSTQIEQMRDEIRELKQLLAERR